MHKSVQSTVSVCSVLLRQRLHPCSSISHRSTDTVPNAVCTSEQQADWDRSIRHSDTVSRLEGAPVLTDRLGHTQASQTFYSSKAVKATVLHPSKGQGLAHVSAAKVIDACHPSLNVAHTYFASVLEDESYTRHICSDKPAQRLFEQQHMMTTDRQGYIQ